MLDPAIISHFCIAHFHNLKFLILFKTNQSLRSYLRIATQALVNIITKYIKYILAQTIAALFFLKRYGIRAALSSVKRPESLRYIYLHKNFKRSSSRRVEKTEENR